ncbi:CocE/NonD family hydrolase [Dyella sp.]|uniref:CocE/NonD family hydrolase n=1 Tax=Dyella sp. TaxID=1869338 RepID=UPI002D76A6CE|nr:CocE/NonD family hydrolase [Dyella sp.]HET7332078.1 CocE/NonD family hydrolase [Dyella sp.]
MRHAAILLSLLLALCGLIAPASAQTSSSSVVYIPTADGYQLQAYVAVPTSGNGPFPLVVMPSSWAFDYTEYRGIANNMANNGYVVVSYSSRGFGCKALLPGAASTCGYVDVAGPLTVGDASTVINWALANTPSDFSRIGISGISYGAGTSLLAAAFLPVDPNRKWKIKAVAALSGWADLVASLNANQTPSSLGISTLSTLGVTGNMGTLMQNVNTDLAQLPPDYFGAVQLVQNDPDTPLRSAINGVAQLNESGTAVLLANAFEDGLFVPSQYINFYNQLTGPKMILFSHGDHTTPEILGAQGNPNEIYTKVTRWFDYYLKGVQNGINLELPVQLKSNTNVWDWYKDWNAVQQGAVTYTLTKPICGVLCVLQPATGGFTEGPGVTWSYSITRGFASPTNTGVPLVTGGQPLPAVIPTINRSNAAVWVGPVVSATSAKTLWGMSPLRLTVTPSSSSATLVASLYSMDPTGLATLITWKPYTLLNTAAGVAKTITLNLEATDYQIPAGNKLALVIDTDDPRYASATPYGGKVTFSSSAATPDTLTVTLR